MSAFTALSCLTMATVAASMLSADDPATTSDAALTGNQWGVEVSTDYGSSWTSTLPAGDPGAFPVQVNLAALADKNFYQPITVRTAVGTRTGATVTVQRAQLLSGSPEQADAVQVRMAASPRGFCASSLFDSADLAGRPIEPRPATAAEVPAPVDLPAAFSTTAGQPETVCVEFSLARGDATPPTGKITLAWPLTAQIADATEPDTGAEQREPEVEGSIPAPSATATTKPDN